MPRLTHDLIRKKSEHNEGTLADLEEISLHQLEIEKIEAIGSCKKLKILYLQNNIIGRIENVSKLKDLEYLNLALNNIRKIENLRSCEFLKKLDLTVNFIDLDVFEESIAELTHNIHLKELYMLGNPAMDWAGASDYIIACLPQLQVLDGKKIVKSQRISALQKIEQLRTVLRSKQRKCIEERAAKAVSSEGASKKSENTDDCDEYTPESRTEMYREVAKEKEEKEARQKSMMPKERNDDKEHAAAVDAEVKFRETQSKSQEIRQCNQGGYAFSFSEDKKNIMFHVQLPRNLSTSLIHVDIFPRYVSVVVKKKVMRIKFPVEVMADRGIAQRSKTTGALKLTIPKAVGEMVGYATSDADYDLTEKKSARLTNKKATVSRTMKLAEEVLEVSRDAMRGKSEGGSNSFLIARKEEVEGDSDEPPPLE